MKRVFTLIGALLVLTGLKAQTGGHARKETGRPVTTTPASGSGNGSGSTGAPVAKHPGTPPSSGNGNGSGSTGAPVATRPGAGTPPPTKPTPLPSTDATAAHTGTKAASTPANFTKAASPAAKPDPAKSIFLKR